MTAAAIRAADDRRLWGSAGAVALAAHLAMAGLVVALARPHVPPPPEPVMLVDLPPVADPAATPQTAQPRQQEQQQVEPQVTRSQPVTPPVDVPQARAAVPDAVTLPPPMPIRQAPPAPPSVSAPAAPSQPAAPAPAAAAAGDPRARKAALDYFSLLSAHLNRRKSYPAEAKKAREEGVVTIRFTVDRDGAVSGVAIKRSSGFALLDAATTDLLRRVAPLPRMPASMARDSITISLPIEYSLKTS